MPVISRQRNDRRSSSIAPHARGNELIFLAVPESATISAATHALGAPTSHTRFLQGWADTRRKSTTIAKSGPGATGPGTRDQGWSAHSELRSAHRPTISKSVVFYSGRFVITAFRRFPYFLIEN
jgi:hypothetical protein